MAEDAKFRTMGKTPVFMVLASASLFGVSTPLAKILLGETTPPALAGLLYLGVFFGLSTYRAIVRTAPRLRGAITAAREPSLDMRDLPWLGGAILAGGIFAPLSLMFGLRITSGSAASLLLNFEGVTTAVLAVLFFRENSGRRVWAALVLMTAAGVFLTWSPGQGAVGSWGPVLIVLAMVGWGVDNNLTRRISEKNPVDIARFKGLVAGSVNSGIAFAVGQGITPSLPAALGLLVGAVCYGLSLVLFIRGLKGLGAFRASVIFSVGPFVGSAASLVLLDETPGWPMAAAAALMLGGAILLAGEKHAHLHRHERVVHNHSHRHGDLHHGHTHPDGDKAAHSHPHLHEETEHTHGHWPDTHHRHGH